MFGDQKVEVIDIIDIGDGTMLRLSKPEGGGKRIELWSSMSKSWKTMYRYNVDDSWASWKKLSSNIEQRKADKKEAAKKPRKPQATPKKAATKQSVEAKPKTPRAKAAAKTKPAAKPRTTRKKKTNADD